MIRSIVVTAALVLFAGAVPAQDFGVFPNEIGLYTTPAPTGAADTYIQSIGGFGEYFTYLVLSRPVNEWTGDPIVTLSGYELAMSLPGYWEILVTYPPGTTPGPDAGMEFVVQGLIPVTGLFTVLAEVAVRSWGGGQSGGIYLSPYDGPPAIADHMAVWDADFFQWAPSKAYPISGSYDLPVAGINMQVVPERDTTWGALKSMYR